MDMMLVDDDVPASQSIDDMWLKTSHFWINAFRGAVQRADARIASQPNPSRIKDDHPLKVELNKIHTHFRQALKSEEAMYRNLISAVVERWQLQPLVTKHLRGIGIKIKPASGTNASSAISTAEKQERIRLVSYALCSLGDMQRYRSQLKVQMDVAANKTPDSLADPKEHTKAREYYDCARYIDYENGVFGIILLLTARELG